MLLELFTGANENNSGDANGEIKLFIAVFGLPPSERGDRLDADELRPCLFLNILDCCGIIE